MDPLDSRKAILQGANVIDGQHTNMESKRGERNSCSMRIILCEYEGHSTIVYVDIFPYRMFAIFFFTMREKKNALCLRAFFFKFLLA